MGVRRPERVAVVYGAFGAGNWGDDLILAAEKAALTGRGFDRVEAIGATWRGGRERVADTDVHPRLSLSMVRSLVGASLLIIGGGQLLDGRNRRGALYMALIVAIASACGVPVAIYGCSVTHIGEAGVPTRRLFRWMIRRARLRHFRDRRSAAWAARLASLESRDVEVGFDAVAELGVPLPVTPHRGEGPVVLVPFGSPAGFARSAADQEEFFVRCLSDPATDEAVRAIVLASDSRATYDGRVAAEMASRVAERLRSQVTHHVPESLEDWSAALSEASLIVSYRMHPLIFGLLLGTPVRTDPASEKLMAFASDLMQSSTLRGPVEVDGSVAEDYRERADRAGRSSLSALEEIALE